MKKINTLLLCGGGGTEHDVSLVSAQYFLEKLKLIPEVQVFYVEIGKDGHRKDLNGRLCELRKAGELYYPATETKPEKTVPLHFAIPCIHGPPGETGEIQSIFELMGLPYFGTRPEGSRLCFNKVTTKLWMDALDIPNTPSTFLYTMDQISLAKAHTFFKKHQQDVFVKASQQGSSIGAYHVKNEDELSSKIKEAFHYSDYVLIEKTIRGRELELSAYEYQGELFITDPGEIICSGGFYDFEEKYSQKSQTQTIIKASHLSPEVIGQMKEYARRAFKGLKMRHLARIDFFLSDQGEVLLNEPNTFPGHTPISMFPCMLEENGHQYHEYLRNLILKEAPL